MAKIQRILVERGASARVTACGCLGPCFDGPNAVLYPEGDWYAELSPDDADAIANALINGVPFEAKRADPPGES